MISLKYDEYRIKDVSKVYIITFLGSPTTKAVGSNPYKTFGTDGFTRRKKIPAIIP